MQKFYSYVGRKGNKIYERGYKDGKPYKNIVDYKPYLYVKSDKPSPFKTIKGEYVSRLEFDSISDAREYIFKYKDVKNHVVYGLTDYEFTYIHDNFSKAFDFDFSLLNVVNTDIETDSSQGFPDIDTANREINAITLAKKGKTLTLGLKPFVSDSPDKRYIECKDEETLLKLFIHYWNTKEWNPDIITGWNIEFFDIPYIINRIKRVLGEEEANKLSPFKTLQERVVKQRNGKEVKTYSIFGIAIIDYYAAYKKFAMNERESYKLDYIAEFELGEKKVDYSEYGSLHNLYVKNPQLYIEYNIHDAVLIEKLENKLHYIEQIVNIAYIERVNFENTLSTVKPWDIVSHNWLMDNRKQVVPFFEADETNAYRIVGGFVKDPVPGHYKNVVSVDFTSLYPSLAMQYNISPDTFTKKVKPPDLEMLLRGDMTRWTEELKKRDLTLTANGGLFRRDERGFIPSIMKEFFDERKRQKKEMQNAQKELQEVEEEMRKRGLL